MLQFPDFFTYKRKNIEENKKIKTSDINKKCEDLIENFSNCLGTNYNITNCEGILAKYIKICH